MKNLIYYPSFEPENVDWLKFALLYIDKLNPIIPESGDIYLNEITGKIMVDTDLIDIHRPSVDEGTRATIFAIEEIEKVLRSPERYSRLFGTFSFLKLWRRRDYFTHKLFREKYTPEFTKFIINNRLGKERWGNIFIPKDVANIYMSILAQVIADERGISTITDNENLHAYSIFTRQTKRSNSQLINLAHKIVELKLPEHIENISLDKIIKFRNNPGFKERQTAFHRELSEYLTRLETDANPEEFINIYKRSLSDFTGDFIELGAQILTIGLGTWMLSADKLLTMYDGIQHLLGSIMVGGSAIAIRRDWANSKDRRFCNKYLAKLNAI